MNEDAMMEMEYEDRTHVPDHDEEQTQADWSGDGSGEDDLADYNQNEADDYRDE